MTIKKVPISKIRKKYTNLPIDRKWLVLSLLVYVISLIFRINIWPIIYLTIFCVANAILLSIDRYLSAPVDLELSTFSAILMTRSFGIEWGLAAAVLTKIAAVFYNKNVRVDHFFMILGYMIAAVFTSIFSALPIVWLGIVVTIIVNLYTVFVSKYITMLSDYEILMYGASNAMFNIVLFIGFSEILLRIMTF